MKGLLALVIGLAITTSVFAVDTLYKGNSKDAKDAICYYKGGRYFSDAACTQRIFHVPGNMVAKGTENASAANAIFRLQGNRIYKGFSINKEDCIATILETQLKKGNVVQAVIFDGLVMFKDKEENRDNGMTTITSYKVVQDNKEVPGKILYTIKDNKIFRGASTDDADCLLTYTGSFNSARLLFMAFEFAK